MRAPERQRLRNLLVGRPQQGALREELGIGVVGLGQGVGQCLRLRGDRCQAHRSTPAIEPESPSRAAAASGRRPAARVEAGRTTHRFSGIFLRLLIRASAEHESGLRCEARQSAGSGIEYNAPREHPASPCRQGRAAHRVGRFDDGDKPAAFGELRAISDGISATAPPNRITS